jgi:inhibitor of the pro-sigma K processing machinery
MEYLLFFGCIVAVFIILKIFSLPFKIFLRILLNIFIGVIMIVLVNIFGERIGLHIPFNYVTALISGFLGIPGVILLIILQYII